MASEGPAKNNINNFCITKENNCKLKCDQYNKEEK